jgi:hypothetical protein
MSDIFQDTLKSYSRMDRLPTRVEAAHAAAVLLLCNGCDLDNWMNQCDLDRDGLRILAATKNTQ